MERNKSIDFSAGLMESFVILLHITIISAFNSLFFGISQRLLFFLMPWFFFKAGMLCKERNPKDEIRHCLRKLAIPFVIFSLLGLIVDLATTAAVDGIESIMSLETILLHPLKTLIKSGSVESNAPIWFLFSLFWVRMIFSLIRKFKINIFVVGAVALTIAFALHFKMYFTPRYIPNVCLGLFFFIAGFVLKELQFSKKWILWISMMVYVVIIVFFWSWVDFVTNNIITGYYLIYVLGSLAGIIAINNLTRLSAFKHAKILPSIGKNSMNYYVIHWFLLAGLNKFISLHYDTRACFYILIAFSIVMLPTLSWIMNKIKGARKV